MLVSLSPRFYPLWNVYYFLWLLSLTNIDIIEKVNSTNEMLKQVLDKWKILDLTPTKWKCQCGQVNDMEIDNCPVCGLKRDFILKKTPKD